MARRGRLSRDQKRKQKLAKRSRPERVQPYEGNKYKSDQFTPAVMQAEIGIYESYMMTGRRLTDRQVEKSLDYLIRELRGEQAAPPPTTPRSRWRRAGSRT
jgi:hypothetical protein